MVITFSSLLLKNSADKWNTLVNFGSASTRLSGQFSVGANNRFGHLSLDGAEATSLELTLQTPE
jgi:hypothetical protein